MSQSYEWIGASDSAKDYTRALTTDQKIQKYSDKGLVNSAVYNPKTNWIHVTTSGKDRFDESEWNNWAKIIDCNEYQRFKALNASDQTKAGRHANIDQATFNIITPEFQDQALRYYEAYKAKGAAVITSTEFPQITVATFSNNLVNRQSLVAQKYNLLGFPEKLTVPDSLSIIYPEYNNTTETVRVGYKENEAIDTSGYGTFTQTNVTLKKAGAGMAFTEEYYMRQFTVDIQALISEKIANDFVKARYNRILTKLAGMTTLAGASWSAYTAGNLMSTNRPYLDLLAAKNAINTADKLAAADTIISNEKIFMDLFSNTWTKGFGTPDSQNFPSQNMVVNSPQSIPWCKQYIINEDLANGQAYVLDSRRVVSIEGPRKTQQINTYNPDQTIFIEKQWFEVVVPGQRTGWGRILTGL